jgi:hypothetical protein
MKAPSPRPGYRDYGLVGAAYPLDSQEILLGDMQPSIIAAWNWMCHRVEEVLEAREARAVREGLMPPAIPRPDYSGLEPEAAKVLKEAYRQQCAERREKIFDLPIPVEWRPPLDGNGSEAERLGFKQDYQVVNNYLDFKGLPRLPALIIDALVTNFRATSSKSRRKKFRRACDTMPIQVKSGRKIRLRKAKSTDTWNQRRCNAEVNLPGIGWIAVYLDPGLLNQIWTPGNTVREGCTLKYKYGRWTASVKIIRREIMHPGPNDSSTVGIDPGLASLATLSDNDEQVRKDLIKAGIPQPSDRIVLPNKRNLKYDDARNLAMAIADLNPNKQEKKAFRVQVFRHDARQKRRVQTQCRQFAAILSKRYTFIGVEDNNGVALGIGSRYVGCTKALLQHLMHRCGASRVREIESFQNSQRCSQCNFHDKKTWERRLGEQDQTCRCVSCGYAVDRDVNSARIVNTKLRELLDLS